MTKSKSNVTQLFSKVELHELSVFLRSSGRVVQVKASGAWSSLTNTYVVFYPSILASYTECADDGSLLRVDIDLSDDERYLLKGVVEFLLRVR